MLHKEKIQLLNPDYQIQELNENFKDYGRVIKQDVQEAINFAQIYQNINAYDTSIKELEDIPCIQELMKDIYGYLDVMAGVVTGKNDVLNGLEYHQCSETVVELYATTLHYTPITVIDSFKTICLLLKGTGDACQRRGILKKKNKWFIAHKDNVEKVQAGDYPGLKGKMIQIKHL